MYLSILLVDTPCTAGARRRWDYANLPLTTTPNLPDSSTFLSTDAIHVRIVFFKSLKKCKKVDPKIILKRLLSTTYQKVFSFFQVLRNRCLKVSLDSSTCPSLCGTLVVWITKSNNQTTTTDLTSGFDLPTDVKSASRNYMNGKYKKLFRDAV